MRLLPFCATHKIKYLKDLDQTSITLFRASWKDAPLTAQKHIQRLRFFFRFCVEQNWTTLNPASNLRVKVVLEQKEPFTPDEMARILATCPYVEDGHGRVGRDNAQELRALILLLRYSGFRISDAVKLEKRSLVPSPTGEGWSVQAHQQKSRRPVYVPIPDHVVDALLALGREGNYFFWTGRSTLRCTTGNWRTRIYHLFKLCEERTSIPFSHKPHPHRFRHTFAAEALRAGVPIEIVSVLLGHSSVKITERFYAKFTKARQAQLDAYLRPTFTNI
jgi:integrase